MSSTFNLEFIKEHFKEVLFGLDKRVIVCAGTGCIANNSLKVFAMLHETIKDMGINIKLELTEEDQLQDGILLNKSGCQGFCQKGPLVMVYPEGIMYTRVQVEDVKEIVQKTLIDGKVIDRLLYHKEDGTPCHTTQEIPFYTKQSRLVLKNCGIVDPENLQEYIAHWGYFALRKCLQMKPEEICQEIMDSGLRGRGGGGFATGKKWEITRIQQSDKKYVICNGDEGDPGAFMDRSIMEGNPHSVIEGMIIAALAIGADEGYVYVRAEYPIAVQRVRKACEDARAFGVLGKNIFGTGKSFDIVVMEGAGAFVCGEETALIHSIEGRRGMPTPKPPYPAENGLFGKPTVINNVETLASVPLIMNRGAKFFSDIGVPTASGTKTFALTGHVMNTGLIEVPFGSTLRNIVGDIAGGVMDDEGKPCGINYKAVQIGGPSGGCLTQEHLDLPLDYDSLRGAGAMVGSGGLVVMNQDTCMVKIAKFFMRFTLNESCGKCVLCREGTKQMYALLDDITEGRGTEKTISLLEELAQAVQQGSLCGLGKTAPNPVLSTLKYFRHEYLAHVNDKKCPTKACKALSDYVIDAELCKGCGLCAKNCPVSAISGEKKQLHRIDGSVCIKCGACAASCKFKAISLD